MGCAGSKQGSEPIKKTDPSLETMVGPHLNTPEDIQGFPIFPEGTTSLLQKYLTKEVWLKCCDKRDKHGYTFRQAIFSGCKNTDSSIGVYAGSHDSYTAFAPLMDKIVEDYHKHAKSAKHVSDMSASKLNAPPLPSEDAEMIVSTRIRVGRNLAGYPLGPGVTKQQREEIMNKVVQACNTFTGDLKGTFYPLAGMSKEVQHQLIQDHFLFK